MADSSYYDTTTLTWTAMQGDISPWRSSEGSSPTLITDYEYRVGDERFVDMTALNFDSDTGDYMWNDLALAMGGTSGYTVIMVLSPNSVYGNNEDAIANALWGPPDVEKEGSWTAFSVTDRAVWMTTDEEPAQKGVAIGDQLNLSAPTYLALVVGRPQTSLYAAVGPSQVRVKSLVGGPDPVPQRSDFLLGSGPLATTETMDMALLDLGVYANQLSISQVRREFASLSQVYGGDT